MLKIKSLCVFCGSSSGHDPSFGAAAFELGRLLAEKGIVLVYGGGNIGLMGIVADAVLAHGGYVTGVIPEHLVQWEVAHFGLNELIRVDNMHERKYKMFERADAFLVLPGGLGTMDEMFEILTWKQLQLHYKPVFLFNQNGFWQPLLNLIDAMIVGGFAKDKNRELFKVVENIPELFQNISGD